MRSLFKMISALSLLTGVHMAWAANDTGANVLPQPKEAQGLAEQRPSIGIFGGFADTQSGRRDGTNYGIEAGYQPYIPFGLGVELSGYVSDHQGDEATLTRTRLLAKGTYNFGGTIPVIKHSYVGVALGPVWDNVRNQIDMNFGIAPQVGFDIPVIDHLTLGANANYLFVGGAKPDVFALNGVAKYWF